MLRNIGLISVIAAYCVCSHVYAAETMLNFDESALSQIGPPTSDDRGKEAHQVYLAFQDAAKGGIDGILRVYSGARSWLLWLAGEERVKALEAYLASEGISYLAQALVFYGAYYLLHSYLGFDGFQLTAGTAAAPWIVKKVLDISGAKERLGTAAQQRLEERVLQLVK